MSGRQCLVRTIFSDAKLGKKYFSNKILSDITTTSLLDKKSPPQNVDFFSQAHCCSSTFFDNAYVRQGDQIKIAKCL